MPDQTDTFTPFDSVDYLHDDEDIRLYLEACLAEDEGDGRLIAHALGTIARARNLSRLAVQIGMSREGLHKALSGRSQPSFATILKVARGLGLELTFKPRPA